MSAMAFTEETLWVELEDIAADTSIPNRPNSRAAIEGAITIAAHQHKGLVHISYVRPLLPAWITPHMIGAVFAALHRTGHLRFVGRYLPNGGTAGRNGSKPAKVSRLTRPIEASA